MNSPNTMLSSMEIPFATLPTDEDGARRAVASAVEALDRAPSPFALLVRKGTFEPCPAPMGVAPHGGGRRVRAVSNL